MELSGCTCVVEVFHFTLHAWAEVFGLIDALCVACDRTKHGMQVLHNSMLLDFAKLKVYFRGFLRF